MNKIILIFILFVISISANDRALKIMKTEQRVALVIGNNIYNSDRLPKLRNPVNDAKAMRDKLKQLDFLVYYGENLSVRDMDKKVRKFTHKLKDGGVGLFFFAGHGVESEGSNYLMGKDSNLLDKDDIAYESLELNKVIDRMKNSHNRLNIVLLDACRNDPFSRSGGGGLAKVDNARGMFIAYATSPGDVASDGSGTHGVFTQMILNNIDDSGASLHKIFKNVKRDVYEKTKQRQRPWTHDDIIGSFFFTLPSTVQKTKKTSSVYFEKKVKKKVKKKVEKPVAYIRPVNLSPKITKAKREIASINERKISALYSHEYLDPKTIVSVLTKNGFEVLAQTTINKKKANVISFTHWRLKELATSDERAFVAGMLRVVVDYERNEVYITNPEYFLRAFMQDDYTQDDADFLNDLLKKSFNNLMPVKDYLMSTKDLESFHFMIGMPHYQDRVSLASVPHDVLINKFRTNTNNKLIFEIKISSEKTLFAVVLKKRTMKFLNLNKLDNYIIMPYMVLVENDNAYILDGKYTIALYNPSLTMSDFMKIMTVPGAIENEIQRNFK